MYIVLCVLNACTCKPQEYPGLLRSYANRKINLIIKKLKKIKLDQIWFLSIVIIKKKIFKEFQFFNGS